MPKASGGVGKYSGESIKSINDTAKKLTDKQANLMDYISSDVHEISSLRRYLGYTINHRKPGMYETDPFQKMIDKLKEKKIIVTQNLTRLYLTKFGDDVMEAWDKRHGL